MSKDDPRPDSDSMGVSAGLDGTMAISHVPRSAATPFQGGSGAEPRATPQAAATPFELAMGQLLPKTLAAQGLDETVVLSPDPLDDKAAIATAAAQGKAEGEANVNKAREAIDKVAQDMEKLKQELFARLETIKAKKR